MILSLYVSLNGFCYSHEMTRKPEYGKPLNRGGRGGVGADAPINFYGEYTQIVSKSPYEPKWD